MNIERFTNRQPMIEYRIKGMLFDEKRNNFVGKIIKLYYESRDDIRALNDAWKLLDDVRSMRISRYESGEVIEEYDEL